MNLDPKFNELHTDYVKRLNYEQKRKEFIREVNSMNKETKEKEQEIKTKINPITNEVINEFSIYLGRNIRTQSKTIGQWDTLKIIDIYRDNTKIILKYKNVDNDYQSEFIFDSKKHLENTLKKFLF